MTEFAVKKLQCTLSHHLKFFSEQSACFGGLQTFEIFCDGWVRATNYFSHAECSLKILSESWVCAKNYLANTQHSLKITEPKYTLLIQAAPSWAMLHPPELHQTLRSYISPLWAMMHPCELCCILVLSCTALSYKLSCIFLSKGAPYWASMYSSVLLCTLWAMLQPTEPSSTLMSYAGPTEPRCTHLSYAARLDVFAILAILIILGIFLVETNC